MMRATGSASAKTQSTDANGSSPVRRSGRAVLVGRYSNPGSRQSGAPTDHRSPRLSRGPARRVTPCQPELARWDHVVEELLHRLHHQEVQRQAVGRSCLPEPLMESFWKPDRRGSAGVLARSGSGSHELHHSNFTPRWVKHLARCERADRAPRTKCSLRARVLRLAPGCRRGIRGCFVPLRDGRSR